MKHKEETMAQILNKPLTKTEKIYQLDMLQGNINRLAVSQDIVEITQMLNFAVDRLTLIAQSRALELRDKTK